MAFNWQTLKTRTLTAAVFVVVMLGGILWNHWSFLVLFTIIHFGCWFEYQRLIGLIDPEYKQITPFHKYGVMIAGWCLMLYFTSDAYHLFNLRLHALGWWLGLMFVFVLPIMELLFTRHIRPGNIGYSLLGLLYISLSLGFMLDLTNPYVSASVPFFYKPYFIVELPVIIILSIWINDTMAYLVGSLIGRTPLSKISPKKTLEGTLGGGILCVAVIFLIIYKLYGFLSDRVIHYSAIAAIAAIAGTFGDLLESKLKRMAGVKDSGHIMPGHGGFLDRFDSMLVATPFVWLYVILVMTR